jgi:multidrug efflux pump subunit AcrA (membrane-fusion protein)
VRARWYTLPGRLLPHAATLAAVVGLVALGVWGHLTGWKLDPLHRTAAAKADDDAEKKDKEPEEKTAPPASDAPPDPDFEPSRRPTHDARTCKLVGKTVAFDDAEDLEKAGIQTRPVGEEPLTVTLRVQGTVAYPEHAVSHPPARAAGTVWQVLVDRGQAVAAGELVALVESTEVARAKADFRAARVEHAAWQAKLAQRRASSSVSNQLVLDAEIELSKAEVHLKTAEDTLANFRLPITAGSVAGVSDKDLAERLRYLGLGRVADRLAREGAPNNLLPVVAEQGGVVTEITAVKGDAVAAGQSLLRVADPTRMVLLLDVRQEAAGRLRRGQGVAFQPDGSDEPVHGRVDRIGKDLDDKTRTVTVRVEVDNPPLPGTPAATAEDPIDPPRRLLAGAFGSGLITLAQKERAVVVPAAAVQWEGCSHVVFVKHGEFTDNKKDKVTFEVRRVRLGRRQGGLAEVLDGVKPGEPVAVTGSHVLKTELFKDRLGEAE